MLVCFVSLVVQTFGWFATLYMFLGDTIPEQHRWMKAALYALMSILVLQLLVQYQWMKGDEEQQAREQIRLTIGTWQVVSTTQTHQWACLTQLGNMYVTCVYICVELRNYVVLCCAVLCCVVLCVCSFSVTPL